MFSTPPNHNKQSLYNYNINNHIFVCFVVAQVDLQGKSDKFLKANVCHPQASSEALQLFKSPPAGHEILLIAYVSDAAGTIFGSCDEQIGTPTLSFVSAHNLGTDEFSCPSPSTANVNKSINDLIKGSTFIPHDDPFFINFAGFTPIEKPVLVRYATLPPTANVIDLPSFLTFPPLRGLVKHQTAVLTSLPSIDDTRFRVQLSDGDVRYFKYPAVWKSMHETLEWAFPLDPNSQPQLHPHIVPLYNNLRACVTYTRERFSFPQVHSRILVRELEGTAHFMASILAYNSTPLYVSLALDDNSLRNVTLACADEFTTIEDFFDSPHKKGWHEIVNNVTTIASPSVSKSGKQRALKPPPSTCLFCHERTSSSREDLQKHLNTEHANLLRMDPGRISRSHLASVLSQCKFCKLAYSVSGITSHQNNCPDRPVECPVTGCGVFMTTRGTTAASHLKHHLVSKHKLLDDTFDLTTAKLINKCKLVKLCTCPNHSAAQLHSHRLFTSQALVTHLQQGRVPTSGIGVGEKWTAAQGFIARALQSYDPESSSFDPKCSRFRNMHFNHDTTGHLTSAAFAAYEQILSQLRHLEPDDVSPIAISLWFLVIFFEPLIFNGSKDSFSSRIGVVQRCINSRLAKLLAGDVEELWNSLFTEPIAKTPPSKDEDLLIRQRVSKRMDQYRFSDAASAAYNSLARVEMNDAAVKNFHDAVVPPFLRDISQEDDRTPPRASVSPPTPDPSFFSFTQDDEEENEDPGLSKLHSALLGVPWGKAAGCAGDTLDFFKRFAIKSGKSGQALNDLLEISRRVIRGQLPQALRPAFNILSGTLFEKPETTPVAYRPIGVPGAFNRLVSKLFCRTVRDDLAKCLTAIDQYAIGCNSGMQIILGSLQLLVQKFLNLDDEEIMSADFTFSLRGLLSLDLSNMFNCADLDIFFEACAKDPLFKNYIPYFDTRYRNDTIYVLTCSDGTFRTVFQKQGSAQGCGLAGIIAAFCLKLLITDFICGTNPPDISPPSQSRIDATTHFVSEIPGSPIRIQENRTSSALSPHAQCACHALSSIKRQHTDFLLTGGAPILSFMDDMSTASSYDHLVAFTRFLLRKGPRAGVYLNLRKTQILLGRSWDRHWRDTDENGNINTRLNIIETFIKIGVPPSNIITAPSDGPTSLAKLNGGIKILGTAIGFRSFVKLFRQKALLKQKLAFQAISKYADDKLHCYLLVRYCVIPMLNHLFCIPGNLGDALNFATLCDDQLQRFFRLMYNGGAPLDSETTNSFDLAKQLVRHGGISFTSPLKSFSACQIASWSLVFAQATPASPLPLVTSNVTSSTYNIHPSTKELISSQLDSPSLQCVMDFFATFKDLSADSPEEFNELCNGRGALGLIDQGMKPKLQSAIVGILSAKATANIYSALKRDEYLTGNQSHFLKIFRSVVSEMGSLFVDNLNMKNRLTSESFLIAIKRKLGIPLIPNIGIGQLVVCNLCNKKAVSLHGDHALSCFALKSQCSKYIHDSVRDATAALLSEYKKTAHLSPTAIASVSIETAGLVDGTLQRPADVFVTFVNTLDTRSPDTGRTHPVNTAAFDISFVASITPSPPLMTLDAPVNVGEIWKSSQFAHLTQREAAKRSATKTGPEGTANYLLGKKIGYIPLVFDYHGGIGSHASEFLYGALVTRPRNTIDDMPTITSQDCIEALWITPELRNSTVLSDFTPPFHPSGLSNVFRQMSVLGSKDRSTDDPFPGDPSGPAARRQRMQLSLAIAGGAALITRLFLANPQASGGKAHNYNLLDNDTAFLSELVKLSDSRPVKKPPIDQQQHHMEDMGIPFQDDETHPQSVENADLSPHPPFSELDASNNTRPTSPDLLAWTVPRPPACVPSKLLRQAGIHITLPDDAISATLALRELLATKNLKDHPLRIALQKLDIHYPKYITNPHRVVKAIMNTIEQSFKAVAMLPRTPTGLIPNMNATP